MGRADRDILDRVDKPEDLKKLSDVELLRLSEQLRSETIEAVSVTGGHLGAGLGVVELTVAIHAVFDAPRDKLIFDVGHQCYPHKILTGRRDRIRSLRQGGGLSGFTRRSESEYDPFGAAHSSTSISAGLGFTVARELGEDVGDVICVIGDGAMSAGMAYEALNNAGSLGNRLIVILNDNDMSISPPVGAMARYLVRLYGSKSIETDASCGDATRDLEPRSGPSLFENLGFSYVGPVDGHDLQGLLDLLRAVKTTATGPVLIHALTEKGKGYTPAENAADKYHGVSRFDVVSGVQKKSVAAAPSYTCVFADALIAEASRDPKVVGVTAAMASGTGLDKYQKQFPDRFFDVGIAEQHAVTFSAGMAAAGLKPFCAIYSTFLQRGFDQIAHDVALQRLPVRFAIDRAGLVGEDGATHAGAFDLTYLSCLPGMMIMAAADEAELVHMVATAASHDEGPSAFRYPRGEGRGVALPTQGAPLPIGKGRVLRQGSKIALLSLGGRLGECLAAATELEARGLSTTVADARFAKPIDRDLVLQLSRHHQVVVTVEEGSAGGFGARVLHMLAVEGVLDRGLRIRTMTLPDFFIDHDSPKAMYRQAGLDAAGIVATALAALGIDESDAMTGWRAAGA